MSSYRTYSFYTSFPMNKSDSISSSLKFYSWGWKRKEQWNSICLSSISVSMHASVSLSLQFQAFCQIVAIQKKVCVRGYFALLLCWFYIWSHCMTLAYLFFLLSSFCRRVAVHFQVGLIWPNYLIFFVILTLSEV